MGKAEAKKIYVSMTAGAYARLTAIAAWLGKASVDETISTLINSDYERRSRLVMMRTNQSQADASTIMPLADIGLAESTYTMLVRLAEKDNMIPDAVLERLIRAEIKRRTIR